MKCVARCAFHSLIMWALRRPFQLGWGSWRRFRSVTRMLSVRGSERHFHNSEMFDRKNRQWRLKVGSKELVRSSGQSLASRPKRKGAVSLLRCTNVCYISLLSAVKQSANVRSGRFSLCKTKITQNSLLVSLISAIAFSTGSFYWDLQRGWAFAADTGCDKKRYTNDRLYAKHNNEHRSFPANALK